jgi:hypothetical protein
MDFPPNYGRQGSISQARPASEPMQEYTNYKAAGDPSSNWAAFT